MSAGEFITAIAAGCTLVAVVALLVLLFAALA